MTITLKLGVLLLMCVAQLIASEKTTVFFVHGANVSETDAHAWASEIGKRLWQAGAQMNFCPILWQSDIGPSYNYQENCSNAFESAHIMARVVNARVGRKIVLAHSLGTLVAAVAMQDDGMDVEKLIFLNSAIPSEAFDASLADETPSNHLVHEDWTNYPSFCWTARWHELFPEGDSRHQLTWRNRFAGISSKIVNFYSSGDEVLEIFTLKQNPGITDGLSSPSGKGKRYSWHKQELWKGRASLVGFMGTTDWSGWGFHKNRFGIRMWSADDVRALTDLNVLKTTPVFNPSPATMLNATIPQNVIDAHLAQGIPSLSPALGRTNMSSKGILSFDMNSSQFKSSQWPRGDEYDDLANRHLHSDVKDVAFFYVFKIFEKIIEVGGLK